MREIIREFKGMKSEDSQKITKKEVERKKSFVEIMNEEKRAKEQIEGLVRNHGHCRVLRLEVAEEINRDERTSWHL